MPGIRRREFITLAGSAVMASPMAARAQEPAVPVVGFLRSSRVEGLAAASRGGARETQVPLSGHFAHSRPGRLN
jgi:putative ABC transport system substrate-binding protein